MQDGCTALYTASFNGHGEVVEKLLEKGASVDVQRKVRGREGGRDAGGEERWCRKRREGGGSVCEGGHGV